MSECEDDCSTPCEELDGFRSNGSHTAGLQLRLDNALAALDKRKNQVRALEAELAALAHSCESARARLAESQAEAARLRAANTELALEVDNHRSAQKGLDGDVAHLRCAAAALEAQLEQPLWEQRLDAGRVGAETGHLQRRSSDPFVGASRALPSRSAAQERKLNEEILQLRATLALRTHHAKQAKRDVLAARDELADARRREGSLARELEASRAAATAQREAAAADGEAAACAARCAAVAVLGALHALRSAEQRAEAEQLASQCADLAARLGRESAALAEAAAAAGRAEARAALELETRLDLERRVAQARGELEAAEGGRAGAGPDPTGDDGVERRALALRVEQLEKELRAAKTRAERAERLAQSHDAAALDLEITLSAAERGLREAEARCAAVLGERDAALADRRAAEEALEAETWRSCALQQAVRELHDRSLLLQRPSQASDELGGEAEAAPANSPSAVPARSLEAALHAMRRLRAEKDALVETVKKLQAALKLQLASAPAAASPAPTTATQRSERARRPHISLPAEGSQQDDSENLASQRGQKTPQSSRAGMGPVPFSPAQSHNLAGQHAWASPVAKHASPVGPANSARFSMR